MPSILQFPTAVLKAPCEDVTEADLASDEFSQRVEELADVFAKCGGLGLSAPQVGWSKRVVLMSDPDDIASGKGDVRVYVLLNPVVTAITGPVVRRPEGCLSFCGSNGVPIYEDMACREACELAWLDSAKGPCTGKLEGLSARVAQHEVDHLAGRLFIDRMGSLQRRIFLKRLAKARGGSLS